MPPFTGSESDDLFDASLSGMDRPAEVTANSSGAVPLTLMASKWSMAIVKLKSTAGEKWMAMSEPKRHKFVEDITEALAKALQLPCAPHVVIDDLNDKVYSPTTTHGGYYHPTRTLYLNRGDLEDYVSVVKTVAHEVRHAYQHHQVENANTGRPGHPDAETWGWEFNHYITADQDYPGYWAQKVECDARSYADGILREAKL